MAPLLQARARGKPDFKYGYILIDKSRQEMAAVRQLELTGDCEGYLLCYFHFLQVGGGGWDADGGKWGGRRLPHLTA